MHRTSVHTLAIVVAAVITATPATAQQMRRSGGSPDGTAPAPSGAVPRGVPRSERHPYAGVWNGSFTIHEPIPVVMVFDVSDSATIAYSGATILPNGARAPHLETTVTRNEMRWKQENSGGGFWVYTAKFVTRDSIAGTVILTDWPQLPAGAKPPAGTFTLARRAPGA